ncbi:glycerol-3-phosphate dehydrogenase/oxidase [Virgibacillus sp. W0181]|uniref:glycerol-3-phosphate dehydrogenase/oxidase n=1 Tax=Virgibacillus sp. W0181 TaxID=3391581 RepID=UPI003F48CD26
MTRFSNLDRHETKKKVQRETLDLLVIGGGITGAGIALDAVSRGLRTVVVEMQDFAAGTSSRSTKLVHGGLRYLKQLEIKLVAEVGKERAIVYENGPHVTTPEWMMLPFHKGGNFGPFTTNIGLKVYDFLAQVRKVDRRKMLSVEDTITAEPLIKREGLKGAGYYVEYKTDDARLTIEVMKKAVENGAYAINYTKAIDFIYNDSGKVVGTVVEDQLNGEKHEIYANKIINASGPWVDTLREVDGSKQDKELFLTKGVHVVFSTAVFPLQQAVYFDAPDGRMIFAIPRDDRTYVGTTDSGYDGDIAHPMVTEDDVDYLLNAINYMFPSLNITLEDVESSWGGLRPLIAEKDKSPDEVSRKDELFISESGLFSIAGGKLTGYRKMAEEVVDKIVAQLKSEQGVIFSPSCTKNLPISGGDVGGSQGYTDYMKRKLFEAEIIGIQEADAHQILQLYGSNADKLFIIYNEHKTSALEENLEPIVLTQLIYAIEYEAAYTPADFFVRRTSALFFNIDWVRKHQHRVIDYMAKVFNWDRKQKNQYKEELEILLTEAVPAVK